MAFAPLGMLVRVPRVLVLATALGLLHSALLPGEARAVSLQGLGVKVGGAYVQADFQYQGEELIEPNGITELAVGVFAEWRRHRRSRFDIVTELLFVRKGYGLDEPRAGFDTGDRIARFLSIPVLLRSNVREGSTGIYIFFGPSLELVLSHDDDLLLDRYRTAGVAGQAGLGLERRLSGRLAALVEFRFFSEFTSMYDTAGDDDTLESVRHRVLQLTTGIRF